MKLITNRTGQFGSLLMAQVITKLANKHEIDLSIPGARLDLEMTSTMPLVIERCSKHMVSVMHTYEQGGDLFRDPEIVFCTKVPEGEGWMPVSYTQDNLRIRQSMLVFADASCDLIVHFNAYEQKDIAKFADIWARALRNQGYVSDGKAR